MFAFLTRPFALVFLSNAIAWALDFALAFALAFAAPGMFLWIQRSSARGCRAKERGQDCKWLRVHNSYALTASHSLGKEG